MSGQNISDRQVNLYMTQRVKYSQIISAAKSGGDLKFPRSLNLAFKNEVGVLLTGRDDGQEILDELAAALEGKSIKFSPTSWVRGVIKKGLCRTEAGLKKTEQRLAIVIS